MALFSANITSSLERIPAKKRAFGFLVFIALLLIVFVWQFHIPMRNQIMQLEKEIAGLRVVIKANDEKIKKLDELKAEVKMLQDRLRVLAEQLPPGSEVSGLLRQIQNQVTQSRLTLKLWRPDKRKTHSSGLYEEIPINIELLGGYHEAGLLFDQVSKMTRIVHMLNLKMTGAKISKSGTMDIKINCTAMTFAAVEKKPEEPKDAKNTKNAKNVKQTK